VSTDIVGGLPDNTFFSQECLRSCVFFTIAEDEKYETTEITIIVNYKKFGRFAVHIVQGTSFKKNAEPQHNDAAYFNRNHNGTQHRRRVLLNLNILNIISEPDNFDQNFFFSYFKTPKELI
jgi:hypothetical protein